MKPKNYEVLMDIYMGVLNAPAIQFTTEDFGMCQITFSLLEDRITPYNLSNCIVRMVINGQQQDCTISDANNGKAEIVLLQSMFTEVGFVTAELQIYDATNQTMRLTTPTFKYTVRKSLMDDNTVQADANYSILQQMILNVSNADKVSSEALKLSKEAKAICDDLVPKANTAAQNAQTALDRAESVVTQEELAQKVMLDGKDTKFDFIKNRVVQDGLVYFDAKTYTQPTLIKLSKPKGFCSISFECMTSETTNGWFVSDSSGTFRVGYNQGRFLIQRSSLAYASSFKIEKNIAYKISLLIYNDKIIFVANNNMDEYPNTLDEININNLWMLGYWDGSSPAKGFIRNFSVYNQPTTPQEIQHNFSVLNNAPSIKELHTTDSEGKTSILKLASDTDHVEDRSGRTQEQINRTFYKRMCKEIPSPSGEPITVKNGEEGYVLSAEIKGNTQLFKRAKGSQDEWIVIPNDEGRDTVAFEYKLDSTQAIISNNGEPYPIYANEEDKANKKVISLPFEEDKVTLNDDGGVTWIDASRCLLLDENAPWGVYHNEESNPTICFSLSIGDIKSYTEFYCDKFKYGTTPTASVEGIDSLQSGWIYVRIMKNKLETLDANGFKKWLSQNSVFVCYRTINQTHVYIPKEITQSILTQQTNILEVGGAVKPSSFKVTVPVDRLAEIEARLQALESTTVDVVLNK